MNIFGEIGRLSKTVQLAVITIIIIEKYNFETDQRNLNFLGEFCMTSVW